MIRLHGKEKPPGLHRADNNAKSRSKKLGFLDKGLIRSSREANESSQIRSQCRHRVILNVDHLTGDVTVPSFGPRMVCTKCGTICADVRPMSGQSEKASNGPIDEPTTEESGHGSRGQNQLLARLERLKRARRR
jgi:hypothetical protein